jgi:hypothetical protein
MAPGLGDAKPGAAGAFAGALEDSAVNALAGPSERLA